MLAASSVRNGTFKSKWKLLSMHHEAIIWCLMMIGNLFEMRIGSVNTADNINFNFAKRVIAGCKMMIQNRFPL